MSIQSCFILSLLAIIVILITPTWGDTCEQTDGKKLLKGCNLLKGASIISQGGTLVNDSNCDVLLPKLIFAKEPSIMFGKADANKFYTVVIVDPDAPNHTAGNFYLHMIRSNIPGSDILKRVTSSSLEVKSYVGPSPPVATGSHRYLFLIYEQTSKDIKPVVSDNRTKFNLSEWIKALPLCGPVAGVQFRARFEL